MAFTVNYQGDSTFILGDAFRRIGGDEWIVYVTLSDGKRIVGSPLYTLGMDHAPTHVVIQPTTDDEDMTKIGKPVKVDLDTIADLTVP